MPWPRKSSAPHAPAPPTSAYTETLNWTAEGMRLQKRYDVWFSTRHLARCITHPALTNQGIHTPPPIICICSISSSVTARIFAELLPPSPTFAAR
jgi:hypothetical protein